MIRSNLVYFKSDQEHSKSSVQVFYSDYLQDHKQVRMEELRKKGNHSVTKTERALRDGKVIPAGLVFKREPSNVLPLLGPARHHHSSSRLLILAKKV